MGQELTNAIADVTTTMSSQVNIGTVATIVGGVVTASIGLFVGWFALRKVVSGSKNALKGKMKF